MAGVGDDGANDRVGMAPNAQWVACRNLNSGVGVVPTYMECMEWFIAPTKIDGTDADTSKAPHVINNSWGCVEGCPQPLLQDTLRASRAAGIFYAVSAGNDGSDCNTLQFPLARYPESFTVGATDHRNDMVAGFSSRGPVLGDPDFPDQMILKPNISAPGVGVRSCQRDGTYANLSGTSMAGPHVAGLVALIISANPALAGNVDRIEDIIEVSAVPKTTTEACGGDSNTDVPNNTYGHGRIDALAAVNIALGDIGAVPLVGVASVKAHGNPGADFPINLPLTVPVGIESRAGQPAAGDHQIVFTFASDVTVDGGTNPPPSAATVAGIGSVGSISVSGTVVTVNLSGVGNEQTLTLTLTLNNVSDGTNTGAIAVPVGVLLGDVNMSRRVDGGDVLVTRRQNFKPVGMGNFRADVNASGRIDGGDTLITRQRNFDTLP